MNTAPSSIETASTRWQQAVNERINQKIKHLKKEYEEITSLRHIANDIRNLRKKLLNEKCD